MGQLGGLYIGGTHKKNRTYKKCHQHDYVTSFFSRLYAVFLRCEQVVVEGFVSHSQLASFLHTVTGAATECNCFLTVAAS